MKRIYSVRSGNVFFFMGTSTSAVRIGFRRVFISYRSFFSSKQTFTGELSPSLKAIVESSNVVVFTWTTCPYCVQAKRLLEQNNYAFTEVNATKEVADDLYKATSQSSVPSVWVKGTFIGGCNDGPENWMGLAPCLKSGKFQELLKK
jgi:glutaredoxin 3